MEIAAIKDYWNNRAENDLSKQSTTCDVYLREIEFNCLQAQFSNVANKEHIIDIGCGDGVTTCRLAKAFKNSLFFGIDYSENMLANANRNKLDHGLENVSFHPGDVINFKGSRKDFHLAYSTRCLINLSSFSNQQQALLTIHDLLQPDGYYFMIENFIEGHEKFNAVRKTFGLSPIPIREHNCYFQKEAFENFIADKFHIIDRVNISSQYYLVTRVIYSKICQLEGREPDYFDIHHQLSSNLPYDGDYGPVQLYVLKKRKQC